MADHCLLYYITDRTQFDGDENMRRRLLLAKVSEATQAGVDYIQLREKDLSAKELAKLACEVMDVIRAESPTTTRTHLLINSRADIALAAASAGVHLRSDDIAPGDVRRIAKTSARPYLNDFLIGVSWHSIDDVVRSQSEKADFAVFAPVFGKGAGKLTAEPTGLAALHEACKSVIPVLALGGVTLENAASCLGAGAAGIAGIRLFQKNRIEDVVHAVRER